mmetsp:Transcript_74398/g.117306  ORF Transcript_74398/g.117306 Transcript_74398/m.117306 type:complete len:134 (+) Transcript_74398:534-935(+)
MYLPTLVDERCDMAKPIGFFNLLTRTTKACPMTYTHSKPIRSGAHDHFTYLLLLRDFVNKTQTKNTIVATIAEARPKARVLFTRANRQGVVTKLKTYTVSKTMNMIASTVAGQSGPRVLLRKANNTLLCKSDA